MLILVLKSFMITPLQEAETFDEEIERIKVENGMLINKISDLMTARDKARFAEIISQNFRL